MQKCCRWAASLGELEATHQEIWGTKDYVFSEDKGKPTVFFGLYDLRDYIALWRHQGVCWILWAGGDLQNLDNGFMFNDGKLKWLSKLMPGFKFLLNKLLRKVNSHYVENDYERSILNRHNIWDISVVPSFLGHTWSFITLRKLYQHSYNPHVYLSASEGRQEEYGFGIIERIAPLLPKHTFHLYGASWETKQPNVIVHGRVSKVEFNREIKHFQCGLRLNYYDGFSEITAKSILMGQYPITKLSYPLIPNFDNEAELVSLLDSLKGMNMPNLKTRSYYLKILNNFPWNERSH